MVEEEPLRALAGKRVLVVEDEFVIAMQIEELLEHQQCQMIGPAASAEEALRLLALERPDAATLDFNLRGQSSLAVAEKLREMGVPFVVVSGYMAQSGREPALEQAAWVRKPFQPRLLLEALSGEMERARI